MKIAQIVSLVTPEGAYGGPVRVAVNQARALIEQGHEVLVFAGTRGYESGHTEIEGVPFMLFPVRQILPQAGFAGITSLGLLKEVRARLADFEVWHIHLARDFITLIAADIIRKAHRPYLLQCHGMIDPSKRLLSIPLDAVYTRPVLREASQVLALTAQEVEDLEGVAPNLKSVTRITNGVPESIESEHDENIIDILYLARLQKRKRPGYFVSSALTLAPIRPDSRFSVVGPDEGEGPGVQSAIANSQSAAQVAWEGSLPPEETLNRMRVANIYVLPSVDEPFPMSVLEAMSVGLPVVITDTCGLAAYVKNARAGIVVDGSQQSLTVAIDELIQNRQMRLEMGLNARKLIHDEFSISAVADLLEHHYQRAVNAGTALRDG